VRPRALSATTHKTMKLRFVLPVLLLFGVFGISMQAQTIETALITGAVANQFAAATHLFPDGSHMSVACNTGYGYFYSQYNQHVTRVPIPACAITTAGSSVSVTVQVPFSFTTIDGVGVTVSDFHWQAQEQRIRTGYIWYETGSATVTIQ
jgi:hypothetical protein